jgi:hypothetical protein
MRTALPFWPLYFLALIAGCTESKFDSGAKSPSDSVSNGAALGRDTVSPQGQSLLAEPAKYLDSSSFVPDGYYILQDSLTIGGRELTTLELNTIKPDTAERKTLLQHPTAALWVAQPNSDDDAKYPCVAAVVTADSLSVKCASTPVGEVTIDGHFLVKSGVYWEKFGESSTVLLVARVVATQAGKTAHDAVHRFVYFAGD